MTSDTVILKSLFYSELASMQSYRTSTTLCVPDPKFEFVKQHLFLPPPSIPIQRIILSACSGVGKYPGGGIPFEVWTRSYYPNVRDQLLAKVPGASISSKLLVPLRGITSDIRFFQGLSASCKGLCTRHYEERKSIKRNISSSIGVR